MHNPLTPQPRRPLFALGQTLMTPGVRDTVSAPELLQAFARHVRGDWGELDAEDKAANDAALRHGGRLVSAYRSRAGTKFWIITEADRSATTALLPDEY